jgi:hypothetical protein
MRAIRSNLEYAAIGEASNRRVGAAMGFVRDATIVYRQELTLAAATANKFAITSSAAFIRVRAQL